MKLLILLSIVAYGYGDKLDRTYLPPPSAGTAGGSPGALTAPGPSSAVNLGSLGQQTYGQQPFGTAPSGQQSSANIGSSRPFGSQSRQPSPVYGPASGRVPTSSNGFGQSNTDSNTVTGFTPNGPSINQPPQGTNSGANLNSGFGQSSGYNVPSNTFSQSPASNAIGSFNQQQKPSGVPQQGTGYSQGQSSSSFSPQSYKPERAQAAADRNAEILRYTNEIDGDRFSYNFETSNGISAEESGVATDGVKAQGGYSYTGDDGKAYTVTYTADENGYQPQGEHLPTPHPIPEEILKSIEKNAQAAAAGTQEGAYRPEEYENEGGVQEYTSRPSNRPQFQSQGQGPSQQYGTPSSSGRPTSGAFSSQSQNNQQTGPQSQGGQNIPTGQSGQFDKPSFTDALNQALNRPPGSSSLIGTQNEGQGSGAPQNIPSYTNGQTGQNQGASGYQYNRPQNNQYSSGTISQSSTSPSRPQLNGQPSSSGAGFPAVSGRPTGSISNGFSSPSGQSSQYQPGPLGPNRLPQAQSFGPTGPSRPISGQATQYQPGSNQGQYQPGSSSQGYNYQAPSGSVGQYQPGSSQNQNRPVSGNQGQYQPASGQTSNRPASNQQYQSGSTNQFQPGSTSQAQNQPGANTQYQANRPIGTSSGFNVQGSQTQPGSQSPQGQFSGANQPQYQPGQNQGSSSGVKEAIQAPYQYNRPAINPSQSQGSQQGLNRPGFGGPAAQTPEQFGGPRQPPSYNPQDGYTY